MKFLEIANKIKDILIDDSNILTELNNSDSIIVFDNEAPIEPEKYPIIFISLPEINEHIQRGNQQNLLINRWLFEVAIYDYLDIDRQNIDYSDFQYLVRLVFNAILNSSTFDESEVNGTSLYDVEMVGFQPDRDVIKPIVGGAIQFTVREMYNTNEMVII